MEMWFVDCSCACVCISGVARMSKLRGHSMHTQCVRNMHLPGDLGHAPPMKIFKIIHSEIVSEAVFGHKYNPFSLTCMVASCPHETCDRTC